MKSLDPLYKNSIRFPIAQKEVEIGLFTKEKDHAFHLKKEWFTDYCQDAHILDKIDAEVWLDTDPTNADALFTFSLREHPHLARWWYEHCFYQVYEKNETFRIIRRTFTKGWQYWDDQTTQKDSKMVDFKKYNLYFHLCEDRTYIEISISYMGHSKVLKKHIESLVTEHQMDTRILRSVIFEKQCRPYKSIEDQVRAQLTKVYPIMGREMAQLLDMDLEVYKDPFKLTTAVSEIQHFYDYYIKRNDAVIALMGGLPNWEIIGEEDSHQIEHTSRQLEFGQKQQSTDIYQAYKKSGPYRLPYKKHFQVFIISTQKGREAKKHLENHLLGKTGYSGFQAYSHLPLVYNENLNFEMEDIHRNLENLQQHIEQLEKDPEVQYLAFYLSPYPKYGIQASNQQLYFKIKEMLLKRQIVSQVIDQAKVKGAINLWIPNISFAMTAKMGGIPWKLARKATQELIVGFGAFRSLQHKKPFVGSSLCFDNEGRFQEFDCWQESHKWAFMGHLSKAIEDYMAQHQHIERLVIHYYKELNKKEFKWVEDLLDQIRADIPIIVVRINSSFNQKELVIDPNHEKCLPTNGSYFHLQYHDYLLYINERQNGSTASVKAARYPLKVSLQSNRAGLFEDDELVKKLMQQLYDFSFLHWRSISQPRVPVTIAYPEYLARIFPHFEAETLQGVGRTRLWFL